MVSKPLNLPIPSITPELSKKIIDFNLPSWQDPIRIIDLLNGNLEHLVSPIFTPIPRAHLGPTSSKTGHAFTCFANNRSRIAKGTSKLM
jgi:hypothetical protein